jgi:soluble lytic murein transglycosylase
VRNEDFSEIDAFLDHYGTLKPARELRYRYALTLGHSGRLDQYFDLYQQFFQGLEIANLDCLALQAEIEAGREKRIVNRGIDKWLVGKNQVDECDPVFDHLRTSGILGTEQYRQRFELAVGARQFPLARYLARSLPATYQENARRWTAVAHNPEKFLRDHSTIGDSAEYREQLLYAAERIAYKNPDVAARLWQAIRSQYPFSAAQRASISRHIALWAARNHLDEAYAMLLALPNDAIDKEVHRWRVRTGLQRRDWKAVVTAIGDMPADEQQAAEWRYWLAIASEHSGNQALADTVFAKLASERSFYGFLAADQAGKEYSFSDNRLVANEATIDQLARRDSMIRARELFLVGLDGRGRSEWDRSLELLSDQQMLQASILAHRWGWHSRAIATVAAAGEFDDLELRYPLPYRQAFEKYASGSNILHSWVLGVARSESLFMRDVRSSAGAVGLMQLMPETGRRTAQEFHLPYAGQVTLTDPDSNIQLGTVYLRKLLDRFDNNRVLATAAYNAGPLNVDRWLPDHGDVDALIWIENIPYNETRKYVRRVLATDTIFHWRLTGQTKRLLPELTTVRAPRVEERLARSD